MVPWFQYCQDLWFTGYDPPRPLIPATAMAPAIIASDPPAPITTSSTNHDSGAKKTGAVWNPIPLPLPVPHTPLPKETTTISKVKPQLPGETRSVPITKPQETEPQPGGGDPRVKNLESSGDEITLTMSDSSHQYISPYPMSPVPSSRAVSSQLIADPAAQNSFQSHPPDRVYLTPPSDISPNEATTVFAGHAVAVDPTGPDVVGVKVGPNQNPASVSGVVATNQGNSIAVVSQIFHLPAPTALAATTILGHKVVPVTNGVSFDGALVTGTSPVVISGTTVLVDKSKIFFGSKAYPLPTAKSVSATTLANGAIALPVSNGVSIYGITLTAGAPAATVSGHAISLDTSNNLIFDDTAQILSSFPQITSKSDQVTTINSIPIKLLPSGVSVAGTTLTPGAPVITASGTLISLGLTVLAVGSSSVPVSFSNPHALITTIGGEVITAAATGIEIGNATLSPGFLGTKIDGTSVSLGPSGEFVIGSKTVMLGAPSGSLGGLIMGGSGSGTAPANSSYSGSGQRRSDNESVSGVQTFEGKAMCLRRFIPKSLVSVTVVIHVILYYHM